MQGIGKFLEALSKAPPWLFVGLAVFGTVFSVIPALAGTVSETWHRAFILEAVLFWLLLVAQGVATLGKKLHQKWFPIRHFHITQASNRAIWGVAKQGDGSYVLQISAEFVVRNRTDEPLHIITVRLVKPRLVSDVIDVNVRTHLPGAAQMNAIPPRQSASVNIDLMLSSLRDPNLGNRYVMATLALGDDDGNEGLISVQLLNFMGSS